MNINPIIQKNSNVMFQRKKDKSENDDSSISVSPEKLMLALSLVGAMNFAEVDARGGFGGGGMRSSSSSRSSYSGRSSYSSSRSAYGSGRSSRLGGFSRSSSRLRSNSSSLERGGSFSKTNSRVGLKSGQSKANYYNTNRDQIVRDGRTYYFNDYYRPINPLRDVLLYNMLLNNKEEDNDFLINDVKKTPDGVALAGYVGNDEFQMEVSKKKDGYSVNGNYLPENHAKKDTIDFQVKNNEIKGRIGNDKFAGKLTHDKDNDSYEIKVEDKDGKRISVDVDKDKKVQVDSSTKLERDVMLGSLIALGVVIAGGAIVVGKEMLD